MLSDPFIHIHTLVCERDHPHAYWHAGLRLKGTHTHVHTPSPCAVGSDPLPWLVWKDLNLPQVVWKYKLSVATSHSHTFVCIDSPLTHQVYVISTLSCKFLRTQNFPRCVSPLWTSGGSVGGRKSVAFEVTRIQTWVTNHVTLGRDLISGAWVFWLVKAAGMGLPASQGCAWDKMRWCA